RRMDARRVRLGARQGGHSPARWDHGPIPRLPGDRLEYPQDRAGRLGKLGNGSMHNVGFTFSNPRRLAFLLLAGLAPMALAEGRFSDPLLGHGLGHSNQGMLGANRHSNQGGDFPGPGPGPTEPSRAGPGQPKFSPTAVLGEEL